MSVRIRPLASDDAPDVLALNDEVVHKLAPMGADEYAWFLRSSIGAWAAEVDGAFAGFVLLLGPGLAYDSANYRWFSERYGSFVYLDRVAVSAAHRRAGVGRAIYAAVEALAQQRGEPVLLEVNGRPRNDASLAFHATLGYQEVGTLEHPGDKLVTMLAKLPTPA
ncbi:MAG: GNAT family N-acetyltransferase [Acidimicrobiales bacterium]